MFLTLTSFAAEASFVRSCPRLGFFYLRLTFVIFDDLYELRFPAHDAPTHPANSRLEQCVLLEACSICSCTTGERRDAVQLGFGPGGLAPRPRKSRTRKAIQVRRKMD